MDRAVHTRQLAAWCLRLIKGIVIGTGFIIPGVSGGVFAAIFGIYQPMIHFFADIRKDFVKNIQFFLPVGIGMLISIVLSSKLLASFFAQAEIPLLWFFIGCVIGTLPSLYKQAGLEGRKPRHLWVCLGTIICGWLFLFSLQGLLSHVTIATDTLWVWLMAGALMGLGAIIPGLSPSNFLLYLGIYQLMMQRLGNMDLLVLLPVTLGALLCVLLLSKAFDRLFAKAYAGMYHFILGIIVASTLMIIPWNGKVLESGEAAAYTLPLLLLSIGTCLMGIALGYGMSLLEKRYKTEA